MSARDPLIDDPAAEHQVFQARDRGSRPAGPPTTSRMARGGASSVLMWVLLAGVLLVVVSLLLGVRHASDADLRRATVTRMALPSIEESSPAALERLLRMPLPDDAAPVWGGEAEADAEGWLVWHDGPGSLRERWISVPDAARVLHVASNRDAVMQAVYTAPADTGGTVWSVPGLVVLAMLVVVLRRRPRTGTRWFWFWVLSLPCCLGFVWYALVECRPTRTPARRRTGWWGILVAVVLRTALLGMIGFLRHQS